MKVDAVFAGGGVKALAFVGAMEAMSSKGISIERAAGTSAGAITAAFIKSGYKAVEISNLFNEIDVKQFLDPGPVGTVFPFLRWLRLYTQMGFYKGEAFEEWMREALANKGVRTFGDLPEGCLKMVASDISNGRFIILPDDLPKYGIDSDRFSVAKAVRMSSSLPFFFEPVKIKNQKGDEAVIVDGGVLSNFPIWLFIRKGEIKRKRPVLGLRLSPEYEEAPQNKITNSLSLLHSMFDTMRTAHDQRYVAKVHARNIIFIPVKGISTTQFQMTEQERKDLINLGKKSAMSFLSKWSY
jgi:NTE family protein